MKKKLLIGGKWKDASESINVFAPFTGELLLEAASAGPQEMVLAIGYADRAAAEMRSLSRFELSRGLERISSGIEARKDEFASLICAEAAKPIVSARAEVGRSIETFKIAAAAARDFTGEIVPVDSQPGGTGKSAYTIRVPKGIIYGITPFNFPLNLVAHKVAPALASGNSIIVKPSEKTPLTSLLLGEIFLESGLPESSLQILPMDVSHIGIVLNDERVKMISFTGSDKVGWKLKASAGKKAVALELGGNAPVIVDQSADVGLAAEKSVMGSFAYSGQVCISVQRIFVHESIEREFLYLFLEKAGALIAGDPQNEDTVISSLIDEASAKRAKMRVDKAVDAGADLVFGGSLNGSILEPTILKNVDRELEVSSEEIFAPVVIIESFSSFDQAVAMANQSRFGLQAGVFTESLANSRFAVRNLEYGGVIINDVPTFRVDNMPYGGIKDSGSGREGVMYAMEEMTDIRLVVENNLHA